MITFDSLSLKAFIKENSDFLTDARIQKIQQPTRRDFIFSIRNKGATRKLYININPQYYHVCFMRKENEEKRIIEIPQKPPMFCMLLRKYLENGRISKVNQPPYERILEFYIETYNELSEKIYLCLAIELMGKHSNIILYNYDTNVIIGCAHNIGSEKSREREMAGTLPYIYPPKQRKTDILNYLGEIDYDSLSEDFFWFSKSFANQSRNVPLKKLQEYVQLKNISPAIEKDYSEFSLFSELLKEPVLQNSVNEMIDNYFSYYIEQDKFTHLKNQLYSIANQNLKKDTTSLKKMEIQLRKEMNSDKYRIYGDLIMANLYNNKDFQSSIEVFDYENNRNIKIELDETKTLKDNAGKFYKLYNKSKTSISKLTELIENYLSQITYYEHLIYSIEEAESIKDLAEIKSEVIPQINIKETKKQAFFPLELNIDNCRVFVGRNNKQNDYIVSKLSKDEDLWFHTKDIAGSHVLLKCDSPSDKTILICAELAKQYSSGKNSSKVSVIYTKRKYLKKPPKANLGYVTYKNEKEIVV